MNLRLLSKWTAIILVSSSVVAALLQGSIYALDQGGLAEVSLSYSTTAYAAAFLGVLFTGSLYTYLNEDRLIVMPLLTVFGALILVFLYISDGDTAFEILITAVATLVATLIGVSQAFRLDRQAEKEAERRKMFDHLVAVKNELELNKKIAERNHRTVAKLQSDDPDSATHYVLEKFSTEAWDSAVNGQVNTAIDSGLYSDLKELYNGASSTNELISRLRTEQNHPSIGDTEDVGVSQHQVWTITVTHWSEEKDKIEESSLGSLIRDRSNSLKVSIEGKLDDVDSEIAAFEE